MFCLNPGSHRWRPSLQLFVGFFLLLVSGQWNALWIGVKIQELTDSRVFVLFFLQTRLRTSVQWTLQQLAESFLWWICFFYSSLRMPWCGNATPGISSKPFICLNHDGLMRKQHPSQSSSAPPKKKQTKKQQHVEDFSWRTHGWVTIFRSNY